MPPDPALQKRRMRARVLVQRRAMTGRPAASAVIADKIARMPEFQNAKTLAAFAPMPEEVDIQPLLQNAIQNGKTLLLPRVENFAQGEMTFHQVQNLDALIPAKFGVLEPPEHLPAVPPELADFFLVPALAADRQNFRLGYGGGFYDRLLAKLPQNAKTCCPVFSIQVKKKIPRATHDRPAWCIITESDQPPNRSANQHPRKPN